MPVAVKTPYSRVWTIQYRASPARTPIYQGWAKAGSLEQGLGDVTSVKAPSKERYNEFDEIAVVRGEEDRPTLALIFRYLETRSAIEKLAKLNCAIDVQIHFGRCQKPTSFNEGWAKIIVVENAIFSNYSTGDLGAFDRGEDAVIDETASLSGEWTYEVIPITLVERAQSEVGQEIVAIEVCDTLSCGDCELPSDGCQRIYAVSAPGAASPGLQAEVVFSSDGGVTWADTWIDTLAIGEDPSDAECVGDYLVVVSNDSDSLHYADSTDIINGAETWSEAATGIVAAGSPNAITAASASDVWIVGDGGYVYYTDNVADGVEVQDAGAATAQDLNAVRAWDEDNVVAVGNSNAVIYTRDGETWAAITGPDTINTPDLESVEMLSEDIWLVGTADNAAWYTIDGGINWTQMRYPGDTEGGGGTGTVWDIKAATRNVVYMAQQTSATAGRILRSINGGQSWYVLPEGAGNIPANDRINSLATCYKEANVVFGGGLADNAADGIIVKGS